MLTSSPATRRRMYLQRGGGWKEVMTSATPPLYPPPPPPTHKRISGFSCTQRVRAHGRSSRPPRRAPPIRFPLRRAVGRRRHKLARRSWARAVVQAAGAWAVHPRPRPVRHRTTHASRLGRMWGGKQPRSTFPTAQPNTRGARSGRHFGGGLFLGATSRRCLRLWVGRRWSGWWTYTPSAASPTHRLDGR